MRTLAAVADCIVVYVLLIADVGTIVPLPLAASSAEEAMLALATASNTGRIVRVVNTAQVATDLSAPTRDASLVHTFVLVRLRSRIHRC
jgi:hypothetical protein